MRKVLKRNFHKLAHVKGDNSKPLLTDTIGDLFSKQVSLYSSNDFLVSQHQKKLYTWKMFDDEVNAFAFGLIKLGYKTGDRLGIWMANNSEWLVTKYATAKLGVILVTINPAYRLHELEYALNLVGVKGLMIQPKHSKSNYIELIHHLYPEILTGGKSQKIPSLEHIFLCSNEKEKGMINYSDVLTSGDQNLFKNIRLSNEDVINIQFTSGTTGSPKAASLTHKNILNNGYFVGERMKFTEKDVLSIPVPLYHCFGIVLGVLAAVTHGSKIILPCPSFDPKSVLESIEQYKCTAVHGVPTMFLSMLNHQDFKKYNVKSLRTGIMAGSNCPIELMKRVINEMKCKEMTICYGMTETSPVSFQTETSDSLEHKVSTVGKIHPHVECKIVGDDGSILPINQPGELYTKGYSVMKGYWNEPNKTKESITEDGFMKTGDIATIDENGYCRITGRSKDMIIRGGENISPREIEEFLYKNPNIHDVSVVGVPDVLYGEKVCAYVILKEGKSMCSQDVKDFCKEEISHYKIPEYIYFVKEFPQTSNGKIQKYLLKEDATTRIIQNLSMI